MTAREFRLIVPGVSGGKGRPRTRVIAGPGRKPIATIYPDPDSAKMERLIKGLTFAAMHKQPLFEGPVELTVEVFLNKPKSWTRKHRESVEGYFGVGKPDFDNIAKLFADAFNGVVWNDDSQVSDHTFRRRYTEAKPHAIITVREMVLAAPFDLLCAADK